MPPITPRPNTICDECEHPRAGWHRTRCATHVRQLLAAIHEAWGWLEVEPRQGVPDVYRVPVFQSRPPINVHVWSLLDPCSTREVLGPDDDDLPLLPIGPTLGYWEGMAARAKGSLDDADWVIHQPWCPNLVVDLRTLQAQVLAAAGEPMPRPVGRCRRVTGLDRDGLTVCDEILYMPRVADRGFDEHLTHADLPEVDCPACGKTYQGVELLGILAAS